MKIIVDAMGGDYAPLEVVKGTALAAGQYPQAQLILTGNEEKIRSAAKEADVTLDGVQIVHAEEVITMEDDPMSILKSKKNSSMGAGLRLLREDGDAFISAGNTGALHTGASLIVRCLPGVHRACIGTVLPFVTPVLLLDSGANASIQPEYLAQWALTGTVYASKILGVENPRVGLLNIGSEETKGTPAVAAAYKILKELPGIQFVGNVEAREVPYGKCDILLTDGFTGNILLKYTEGMGAMFFSMIKELFYQNAITKVAALAVKKGLRNIRNTFDASAYGAAPIIGIAKPVFKAHGNSDAPTIANAVRQAVRYLESGAARAMAELSFVGAQAE